MEYNELKLKELFTLMAFDGSDKVNNLIDYVKTLSKEDQVKASTDVISFSETFYRHGDGVSPLLIVKLTIMTSILYDEPNLVQHYRNWVFVGMYPVPVNKLVTMCPPGATMATCVHGYTYDHTYSTSSVSPTSVSKAEGSQ